MNDRLEKALTEVKAEMSNPETESTPEEKKPVKKTTAKKKVAATTKKPATAKKAKKVVDENQTSLKDLAKELKLEARDIRRILRKAKIENDGRWSWAKDSGALKKVRDILTKKG